MAIEVRTIRKDEVEDWAAALRRGFLDTPRGGEAEAWGDDLPLDRTRGALDGGRFVGTLRSFASEMTLPGGARVPVSALTSVTVLSTHRRQGLLTRMIGDDLRDSAERGEAASILIASEYPIYGRYGYGPATELTDWEIDADAARFRFPGQGEVRLADPAEAREAARTVWDAVRATRPGAITRDRLYWDTAAGVRSWPGQPPAQERLWAVCTSDGAVTGALQYSLEKKWTEGYRPQGVLTVHFLFACDPEAEARLWRYACEVDWMSTVKAAVRPVDERLPWYLVNARAARQVMRTDMTWVRPLDVPRLLGGRALGAPGDVVLQVEDPLGYAAGRFRLDGSGCRAVQDQPDVTLPVSMLGAVSLGGTDLRALAAAGLAAEHRPGAIAWLAAMLAWPESPWTGLWF